jgi:hypothetical protein
MTSLTQAEKLFKLNSVKFKRYLVMKRFLTHIAIGLPNDCWEWEAALGAEGYGAFDWPAEHIQTAHVASYVLFKHHIPKRHGKKKLYVLHTCDNRPCVNPNHLYLGTHRKNMQDRKERGRGIAGERHHQAKLTNDRVRRIRALYIKGKYTASELADKFHVTSRTIFHVVSGRTWSHLPERVM